MLWDATCEFMGRIAHVIKNLDSSFIFMNLIEYTFTEGNLDIG